MDFHLFSLYDYFRQLQDLHKAYFKEVYKWQKKSTREYL